jgi:hypothetical protein
MSLENRTLYEVLGITRNAKPYEIERAYRRLRADMQKETVAPDPRQGVIVQNAYDVLSDPVRRESYDASLRAPVKALRRAQMSPRFRAAVAGGGLVVAVLVAWFAFRPDERQRPRDPREIAEAASLAVGRVQGIDVGGAVTPLGLAFAIDKGALATNCAGLTPTSQLVVGFAQRKVPARVATIYQKDEVCRLAADGMGSWPLAIAPSLPFVGQKVYATQLSSAGQLALIDGHVRRVAGVGGLVTIEVGGPASSQLAGGPLLDAQGRVLGVGEGGGRYRPVPRQWIAEMNLPPQEEAPQPAKVETKHDDRPPIEIEAEKAAHERAEKLRYLENLK